MKLRLLACAMLLTGFTVTVTAQKEQTPKTMDSPTQKDAFEKVHENLLGTTPDKAVGAGRLTDAVAGSLPPSSSAFQKIPRNNLIDEHIFARIERDRAPIGKEQDACGR